MKPKIFIGSSVEGLSVAYAIQQNLTHDAEPTVWDQGVFELSKTSIESLSHVVGESDFGIFVFSPDDISLIRNEENKTIRDNVIFEFGLFIGRLGRDRVFFIIPENIDFHLPTDLLGVTPAKYNANREDRSLQAATGPACNQIRQIIKKLPIISARSKQSESDEASTDQKDSENDWVIDLFDNKYDVARKKLKKIMKDKTGEELLLDQVWLSFIDFRENEVKGLDNLLKLANSNKDSLKVTLLVSQMLTWEHYFDVATELLDGALEKFPNDPEALTQKSECLRSMGNSEESIAILKNTNLTDNPNIALELCTIYEDNEDIEKAIECIHTAYKKYPSNESLLYKYARLLQDANRHKEAIYLLNYLTNEHPEKYIYWGYLSNSCLQLDLYEKAMSSCRKAKSLSKEKESWILHNIGNLLNNKGFYSDAEEWLNKGLKLEPTSEYAHDRLAATLKSKNEESKKFEGFIKEGRILLRKMFSEEKAEPKNNILSETLEAEILSMK